MNARQTQQDQGPEANDWASRRGVHALVLLAATALGTFVCYRLTVPFLPALAWALTLAALFGPSGLILGPVALTITTLLLEIWRDRIADPTQGRDLTDP